MSTGPKNSRRQDGPRLFFWVGLSIPVAEKILATVTLKNPTVGIGCNLRIHEWLHDSKGTKITADFGPTAART